MNFTDVLDLFLEIKVPILILKSPNQKMKKKIYDFPGDQYFATVCVNTSFLS